ncbi:GH36 C-terminal domain-containing protein [Halotalea alkalilenta]|uniref:GH36 C-terminal domain-containing protein n=1 Tax=Halotalea alkalilenta TaxID=376489 RepID=UPI00248085BD|nr:GH36 C-terminal domain-containing protein [Halotalea alkalilenta]
MIDDQRAVVMVAQLATPSWAMNEALRIPYLDPRKRYRVSVLDRPNAARDGSHTMRRQVPWMAGDGFEASGAWLAEAGLRLPQMDPESALLIELEAL